MFHVDRSMPTPGAGRRRPSSYYLKPPLHPPVAAGLVGDVATGRTSLVAATLSLWKNRRCRGSLEDVSMGLNAPTGRRNEALAVGESFG
jgi:hypothetical protein